MRLRSPWPWQRTSTSSAGGRSRLTSARRFRRGWKIRACNVVVAQVTPDYELLRPPPILDELVECGLAYRVAVIMLKGLYLPRDEDRVLQKRRMRDGRRYHVLLERCEDGRHRPVTAYGDYYGGFL